MSINAGKQKETDSSGRRKGGAAGCCSHSLIIQTSVSHVEMRQREARRDERRQVVSLSFSRENEDWNPERFAKHFCTIFSVNKWIFSVWRMVILTIKCPLCTFCGEAKDPRDGAHQAGSASIWHELKLLLRTDQEAKKQAGLKSCEANWKHFYKPWSLKS